MQAFIILVLLLSSSDAQTCVKQRVFSSGFANPLVCDGDGGGSQISVFADSVVYKVLGGGGEKVKGLNVLLPDSLQLVIKRRSNGEIKPAASFIKVDGRKFKYGRNAADTNNFRLYFNALQVLVRQFETGDCPIDSKAQKFPGLASVRGGLLALSSTFVVKDCSGGII